MGMNGASRTVLTEALFVHLILICCKQTYEVAKAQFLDSVNWLIRCSLPEFRS